MVGRAGRAGIDSVGESVLILQEKDRQRVTMCSQFSSEGLGPFHLSMFAVQAKSLVCAPTENCYSNLMHDDGKGLLSLILSLVGLKVNPVLRSHALALTRSLDTDKVTVLCCRWRRRWIS